jgi:hypothetical protein
MEVSEELLEHLKAEAGAELKPASAEELEQLKAKNVSQAVIDYFERLNISAELDGVYFCDAVNALDLMESIDPNCEIWPHGYIGFAGDFEGRTYCFDQNELNADGEPTIIRFDYPFGDTPSQPDLRTSAIRISNSLEGFVKRFLKREFA